jgi:integrase
VARRIRAEKTLGKYRQHTLTWEAARDEFVAYAKERNRQRTWSEYKRTLTSYFPFKGNLHDITPKDVANKLSAIEAPSQRDHALAYLRIFFRWTLRQNFIDTDPTAGLQKTKAPSRTRLLTDDEIRAIWQATEEPTTFNLIVRLLILTGQRRNEIASLKPEYTSELTYALCRRP